MNRKNMSLAEAFVAALEVTNPFVILLAPCIAFIAIGMRWGAGWAIVIGIVAGNWAWQATLEFDVGDQ